mmetsp:Transcript_72779/g.207313  ORF Transcript_72779/g.207313 Transcript_72779/m.207313 type:complete len:80 (+) Transcript_72779:492-731(+)
MVVQPDDPVNSFYRYLLDRQGDKVEPAVKDAKKSQAQILEELKPVLTTMMQKMVETQAEDPMEFMIAYLKDIVSDTPAS